MHLFIAIFLLFLNLNYRTLHQLRKHLPSMSYVSLINALYYYVCKHHLVWDFDCRFFSKKQLRALHIFVINPLIILLFLSRFPNQLHKKVIYVLKWTVASVFCEFLMIKNDNLFFKRGWNLKWSSVFYLKMYLFSCFFNSRKTLILSLSALTTFVYLRIFHVPPRKQFLLGPILSPSIWKKFNKF